MRVKRIKGAYEKVKASNFVVKKKDFITRNKPIHLEIGAGKGQFIYSWAKERKDITFVAVEKYSSVCYRIVQKQEEECLENLFIINDDAHHLFSYLKDHSVDKIYLNFSDPWPKPRHHKRRLTHPDILKLYKRLLKTNGTIEFRTDSFELFTDSLEYFKIESFKLYDIINVSPEIKYMSEYEINKRKNGPIYSLKAKVEA